MYVKIDTVVKEQRLPYTVVVEGNVGAGKSTFVDILAREDARISPVPEPVNAWQNVSGTGVNLLDSMFRDGKNGLVLFNWCLLYRGNVALFFILGKNTNVFYVWPLSVCYF